MTINIRERDTGVLSCINDAQLLAEELAWQFINMLHISTMCIEVSVSVFTAYYRVVKDIFLFKSEQSCCAAVLLLPTGRYLSSWSSRRCILRIQIWLPIDTAICHLWHHVSNTWMDRSSAPLFCRWCIGYKLRCGASSEIFCVNLYMVFTFGALCAPGM